MGWGDGGYLFPDNISLMVDQFGDGFDECVDEGGTDEFGDCGERDDDLVDVGGAQIPLQVGHQQDQQVVVVVQEQRAAQVAHLHMPQPIYTFFRINTFD